MEISRKSESKRLETLWGGSFGDAYIERNRNSGEGREPFWGRILSEFPLSNVLEVGCNVGPNLELLASHLPERDVFGVDINENALKEVRSRLPGVNALWSPARTLPFRDSHFDMVFTTGVLIHQPPETLPLVMAEIVRCSKRYVLCGEYYASKPVEVPYRNEPGSLFKRDFGALYQELFPELHLMLQGFLPKEAGGWDDLTFWVFEKG